MVEVLRPLNTILNPVGSFAVDIAIEDVSKDKLVRRARGKDATRAGMTRPREV